MRVLIPTILALSTTLACNCAAVTPVIQREETPFLACVPQAIPAIIACHASPDEATCIVLQVTALVACWTQHRSPAPSTGSGSGEQVTPRV